MGVSLPVFILVVERIYHGERTGMDHQGNYWRICKYIGMELDYRNEVENHKKMHVMLSEMDEVIVPKLNLDLCMDAIICMEYIDSYGMREFLVLSEITEDLKNDVYKKTTEGWLEQFSKYGFFQADTQTGENEYCPALLIFGCGKQLPNELRSGILKAMQGYINRDHQMCAQAFWDMSCRTKVHTIESLLKWAEFVFEIVDIVVDFLARATASSTSKPKTLSS